MSPSRWVRAAVGVWVLVLGPYSAPAAWADDLVVLAAAAVKTAVAGVPAAVESGGRDHVRFVFGTAGAMRDAAVAGRPFDLVLLPPATLADLAGRGLTDAGSEAPLGSVRLGAAVPADAPAPPLATVAELTAALRQVPSLAMADPAGGATSGRFLDRLFGTLGLRDIVGPKLKLFAEGQAAMEAVSRHEAALGLGQMSEAAPVRGLTLVPLPDAAQLRTVYAMQRPVHPVHAEATERLRETLLAPATRTAFAANGFDLPP